ncbi:MAG: ADP-ribosylglycohydrolase family protein, partial [Candidatus Bathyarchaeota archaeon]|nr:ADP-ribosylglycohydrolase family protein [Candidatus Bathyarchaeota archaeon]
YADYMLWHANQCARYNILNGIMPPDSGHWLNNPCAEDIDFQIEADFAGLMSPGMVNTSAEISDKIGHIMNYGDGWYGGVYVAAMYALAFISDDIQYVVEEALKVIPEESQYAQCMQDVIQWHKEYPDDWKITWQKIHDKWDNDVGCPHGVFNEFNIDAKINSAWILVGLLYGEKDFGKTIDISTRCGDDSDCNPASAGGILGTMLGYSNIPDHWKQGLAEVEPIDFKYTTISLNRAYEMSYRQALEVIKKNGGVVDGEKVAIKVQKPRPVRLEVGFEEHYPVERRELNVELLDEASFEFEGVGFAVNGATVWSDKGSSRTDHTFEVEMYIDGVLTSTTKLPTNYIKRKFIPFWKYQLPMGKHAVQFKVLNPTDKASIRLSNAIIYSDRSM